MAPANDGPDRERQQSLDALLWTIQALTSLKEGAMLAGRVGSRLPGG